jgi:drug/metabolite transporter (DMT)-like permease
MGLLYAALAQGQMGIVSPITAVLSGAVPVLVGVIRGESLSPTAIAGILAAGLAVILVSRETGPHKKTPPRAIAIALASGLAIGAYLSVLGSAPDDSGIWVATIGRWFSSILVLIALIIWLVRTGAGWAVAGSFPWGLAVAAGGLDALANAVFQLAAQRGLLAIVAVIGSLYPAATLLLARFLLHERISRVQLIGVALALAAAATLALA